MSMKKTTMLVFWFMIQMLCIGCAYSPENIVSDPKSHLSPEERYGELFHHVQTSKIFSDSKTFVDSVPKRSAHDILRDYRKTREAKNFDLKIFVEENFELPPSIASGFKSDASRTPEEHIEVLWDVLIRKPDESAGGSIIPMPHPYVVPGGRFREVYYWDTYFTMLGLVESGRIDLVEDMVDNFSYLIDSQGFIPNGNRAYYRGRSQPPFYSLMVELLADARGNGILSKYAPQLLKEYAFWMDGSDELTPTSRAKRRVVLMPNGAVMNRFWDDLDTPRPESYVEDIELAEHSAGDKSAVYRHIRAAAESGWDFSSRWFKNGHDMTSIHTTDIVPVDLNSLLYHLEIVLARAHVEMNQPVQAQHFREKAAKRREALNEYSWDAELGFYRDYDFIESEQTRHLSLAAMYPLFFHIADINQAADVAKRIEKEFLQAGGVTTTLKYIGQQWDSPNGWAPLHWITIKGLENYGQIRLAETVHKRWVALNVGVYSRTGKMVEKYNVYDLTLEAGGGEYPVQDGFGWTNGVLLKLLKDKSLTANRKTDDTGCLTCKAQAEAMHHD